MNIIEFNIQRTTYNIIQKQDFMKQDSEKSLQYHALCCTSPSKDRFNEWVTPVSLLHRWSKDGKQQAFHSESPDIVPSLQRTFLQKRL